MENLLITGGAGFIGSNFIRHLFKTSFPCKIICVDNFNNYYHPAIKMKNIEDFRGRDDFTLYIDDITDYEAMAKIFSRHDISTVVHLAARAGVRPSIKDPLLYEKVNVTGTLNLLELARLNHVKKFIFASSSSVYGNNKKIPFSEKDNVDFPISPYAATKKSGELICHTYHALYSIDCFCLRFFTVYGPSQRPEMAIHKFVRLIDQGKEMEMYGDGSSSRDYTYIDDITVAVATCLKKVKGYEIINLGNSHPIKLSELIGLIEKSLEKKAKIVKKGMQPGDVERTYADIGKAKKLLRYNPKTKIEQGIKKFVNWYHKEKN